MRFAHQRVILTWSEGANRLCDCQWISCLRLPVVVFSLPADPVFVIASGSHVCVCQRLCSRCQWVCGCVGVWVSGCVGVWVLVCGCGCVGDVSLSMCA